MSIFADIKQDKSPITQFHQQENGSSILEFVIILPILVAMIFGTIQLGLIMVSLNALDAAAREAARFGITGTASTGLTREASISQVIQTTLSDYSGGIVDGSKVAVTVESFPNLTSLGDPKLGTLNSFGTGGQVVNYKLQYNWDTIFPIFGTSAIIPLTAETAVVNEQF